MTSALANIKAWTHATLARKTLTYVVGMSASTVAFLSLMGFLLTSMTDAAFPSSPDSAVSSIDAANEGGEVVALASKSNGASDAAPTKDRAPRSTQEK